MALGEGKFDDGGARNRRDKRTSGKQTVKETESSLTSASSRCRSKAALNGVILSSASWFDENRKKKKKKLANGYRGNQLGRV
jgi:hypothetical protein